MKTSATAAAYDRLIQFTESLQDKIDKLCDSFTSLRKFPETKDAVENLLVPVDVREYDRHNVKDLYQDEEGHILFMKVFMVGAEFTGSCLLGALTKDKKPVFFYSHKSRFPSTKVWDGVHTSWNIERVLPDRELVLEDGTFIYNASGIPNGVPCKMNYGSDNEAKEYTFKDPATFVDEYLAAFPKAAQAREEMRKFALSLFSKHFKEAEEILKEVANEQAQETFEELTAETQGTPEPQEAPQAPEKKLPTFTMETVSRIIKDRFEKPWFDFRDSTPNGFPQPRKDYKYVRPGAGGFSSQDSLADVYNMSSNISLTRIVTEYNNYSVFRYLPKPAHMDASTPYGLEDAIRAIRHHATQARGIKNILEEEFSMTAMGYARQRVIELINDTDSMGDYAGNIETRPDWAVEIRRPADMYFVLWLLHLEGMKEVTVEKLKEIDTKEKFMAVFDNSDIDLVEAALIQAVIYYHGRDANLELN